MNFVLGLIFLLIYVTIGMTLITMAK